MKDLTKLITFCLLLTSSAFSLAETEAELMSRVAKLERMIDNRGLLNILDELHSLQKEVQDLRGEVEQQAYTIKQLEKRNQNLYNDLDQRLAGSGEQQAQSVAPSQTDLTESYTPEAAEVAVIEPEPVTIEVTASPDQTSKPVSSSGIVPVETYVAQERTSSNATTSSVAAVEQNDYPQAVAAADTSALEEEQYSEAFNLLKLGKNDVAVTKFRQFLEQYPGSEYADNAQYWLGEAFYAKRNFHAAMEEYKRLLANYPESGKASHAQLKLGYSYDEVGEADFAQGELEDLIARYPGTSAARLAEERLIQIRSH